MFYVIRAKCENKEGRKKPEDYFDIGINENSALYDFEQQARLAALRGYKGDDDQGEGCFIWIEPKFVQDVGQ